MRSGAAIATERTPLLVPKPAASFYRRSAGLTFYPIYPTRLLLALSYASFSGVISGMCLLFAKSGVELLLVTLSGHNQFWRWQAWILVLGLVVFAFLQLWYLHKALVLADPTLVCPREYSVSYTYIDTDFMEVAFCFYNLSSIVNGLVYFNQFSLIPPLHLSLIILGIFVLLGGVWVVTIQSGGGNANIQTPMKDGYNGAEVSVAISSARDIEGDPRGVSECGNMEARGVISLPIRNPTSLTEVETLPDSVYAPSTSADSFDRPLMQSPREPSVSSRTSHRRTARSPEWQHLISRKDFARLLSPSRGISHRRRSTVHTSNEPGSSQRPHRTPSFNYTHANYAQISPPLMPFGTASTLGTGFQIGLSPVSPGFAIVPRERGRRSSELGLGVESGFAHVVIDATRTRQRRRTVSEGDACSRALVPSPSQSDSEHEHRGIQEDHVDGEADGISQTPVSHNKAKPSQGKLRWQWLRKIFLGHQRSKVRA